MNKTFSIQVSGIYSILNSLHGELHEYIEGSGFTCVYSQRMVRELVSSLAAYREENFPLFPEVFIFARPDGLEALAAGCEQVGIGTVPLGETRISAAATILKQCAALASDAWAIFVVKEIDHWKYGMFRANRHSLAKRAEESMPQCGSGHPIILVRNRGHLVGELKNTKGEQFTATFKSVPAAPSRLEQHVGEFVQAISKNMPGSDEFDRYLKRILAGVLQKSHGTLLAAIEPPKRPDLAHSTLRDGIWPARPIEIWTRYQAAMLDLRVDSMANLQAVESLLAGMVNSDGVVILGTDGTLQAFRVFLKPTDAELRAEARRKRNGNASPNHGGGRRRTFELMSRRTPKIFKAVFFLSQDGETQCKSETNERR